MQRRCAVVLREEIGVDGAQGLRHTISIIDGWKMCTTAKLFRELFELVGNHLKVWLPSLNFGCFLA